MRSIAMVVLAMTQTGGPLVVGARISQTFTYTGAVQVLTLTTSGLYHPTVNGAAGGGSAVGNTGNGLVTVAGGIAQGPAS